MRAKEDSCSNIYIWIENLYYLCQFRKITASFRTLELTASISIYVKSLLVIFLCTEAMFYVVPAENTYFIPFWVCWQIDQHALLLHDKAENEQQEGVF